MPFPGENNPISSKLFKTISIDEKHSCKLFLNIPKICMNAIFAVGFEYESNTLFWKERMESNKLLSVPFQICFSLLIIFFHVCLENEFWFLQWRKRKYTRNLCMWSWYCGLTYASGAAPLNCVSLSRLQQIGNDTVDNSLVSWWTQQSGHVLLLAKRVNTVRSGSCPQ